MHSRLRPLRDLPPLQARTRVRHLRARAKARGDTLFVDALDLLEVLIAVRAWLRHDPECLHRSPTHTGATHCTCGLTATLMGHTQADDSD